MLTTTHILWNKIGYQKGQVVYKFCKKTHAFGDLGPVSER
jgi:hypothetical protein